MDYTDVLLGNYFKHAFRRFKPPEDGRKRLFCAVTRPGYLPKQSRSWRHRIGAFAFTKQSCRQKDFIDNHMFMG